MLRPVVDGGVDGEAEIEKKDGHEKEVKGRVVTGVAAGVLRVGHVGLALSAVRWRVSEVSTALRVSVWDFEIQGRDVSLCFAH